jgi:hypothetical protein
MRARALIGLAAVALAVVVTAAATAKPRYPVLGVRGVKAGVLVQRYDRQTLRPYGSGLYVGAPAWTWSRSPDRTTVALAGGERRGVVVFLDVSSLRLVSTFRFASGQPVAARWVTPDRLLLVTVSDSGAAVRLIDPRAPRQLRQLDVPGQLVRGARTSEGIALLVGPSEGLGSSRLVLVDGELGVRTLALAHNVTGWLRPADSATGEVAAHMRAPALAVSPGGVRAVVVGADEPVAEIDLVSGAVTYHQVNVRRASRRAKLVTGPDLQAEWLRSGAVAVTGTIYGGLDETSSSLRQAPFGLMLLDTRTWAPRIVDPLVHSFVVAGDRLVVAGERDGITWYDVAGRRQGHVLGRRSVTDTAWVGTFGLARSWSEARSWFVDLGRGRVAGAGDAVPPMFLDEEPHAFYG